MVDGQQVVDTIGAKITPIPTKRRGLGVASGPPCWGNAMSLPYLTVREHLLQLGQVCGLRIDDPGHMFRQSELLERSRIEFMDDGELPKDKTSKSHSGTGLQASPGRGRHRAAASPPRCTSGLPGRDGQAGLPSLVDVSFAACIPRCRATREIPGGLQATLTPQSADPRSG